MPGELAREPLRPIFDTASVSPRCPSITSALLSLQQRSHRCRPYGDRKPRVHGIKPLHVRKREMHACEICEPKQTKRWTMVEIGYDLGSRPMLGALTKVPRLQGQAGRGTRRRS